MRRGAVYVRLSKQGELEESLDRQAREGAAALDALGYACDVFREPAGHRSGYYESNRPEWKRLKKLIGEGAYQVVWVADLSRASRNRVTVLQFLDWIQSLGVQFISQKEQFDFSTAAGKALVGVLAVFNQFYRDDISERKKRQYASRDKSLYAASRAPFGLKRTGSYPNIVWSVTDDFPVIVRIAELYIAGHGAPTIARLLNKEGARWVDHHGQRVPVKTQSVGDAIVAFARYEPFLDPVLYARVCAQRERQRLKATRMRAVPNGSLLLSGLLRCAHCGEKFWTVTQRAHNKTNDKVRVYRRYAHYTSTCPTNRFLRPEVVDYPALAQVAPLTTLGEQEIERVIAQLLTAQPPSHLDVKLKREKLLERLRGFEEMRADKEITRERFLEVKFEIEEALGALPTDIPPTHALPAPEVLRMELRQALDALLVVHELEPATANLYLRGFVDRVLFDGHQGIEVKLRPPFDEIVGARV